jgi:starvation-inducible DNA-binding protein
MLKTMIDVPEKTREAVNKVLQASLVDTLDLALQAKQAHWNVKGLNFLMIHELFDETASELHGFADDLAERIATFGGSPVGTSNGIAETSRLPKYPTDIHGWKAHVETFSKALAALAKSTRAAIDETAQLGDAGTADLYTGMSRALDKRLWFLESHLHEGK